MKISIGDALKTRISSVQDQVPLLEIAVLIGISLQNHAALVLNAMVNIASRQKNQFLKLSPR